MTRIEVTDLVLRRGPAFQLGPLSLDLPTGSRTALVGPSGCGKTTLLRCLAGLERPDSGIIRFDGQAVTGDGTPLPPERRQIGFVFQSGALWPHMTAVQHIAFVAPALGDAGARALLDDVGLSHCIDRRPGRMSGGEGQRLALARALAGVPRILLLDEPLHSVDVHLRDELAVLIRRVAEDRGLTLVLVTHDRDEALAMADRLAVLRHGHLVEQGNAAELLAAPTTAFAASFLGGAVCLPARTDDNGSVTTVFGTLPTRSPATDELSLVLLPGDVGITEHPGPDNPRVRVHALRPGPAGPLAAVELGGHTVLVPCPVTVRPGVEIALQLRAEPRLLPGESPQRGGTP